MNDLTNAISSVGFPIVMCLILVYFQNTTTKQLTEAINELKVTMTTLISRLERDEVGK